MLRITSTGTEEFELKDIPKPVYQSDILLSILTPVAPHHAKEITQLQSFLSPFITAEVEHLILPGPHSTGVKRNTLMAQSKGHYIMHLDADDLIHPTFIPTIIKYLKMTPPPDCIGFKQKRFKLEKLVGEAIYSSSCFKWVDLGNHSLRTECHLTPLRRDIALSSIFPDRSHNEDVVYAKLLREKDLVRSEVFINDFMYWYFKGSVSLDFKLAQVI